MDHSFMLSSIQLFIQLLIGSWENEISLPLKAFLPSALWGEGLGKTDELGRHRKYDNIHWWSILVRRACLDSSCPALKKLRVL